MKDDILFYEKQPFWRAWWWIIALVLFSTAPAMMFEKLITGTATHPTVGWIVFVVFTVAVLFWLFVVIFNKMRTTITHTGIYLRYSPIGFRTHFFAWKDIEEAHFGKSYIISDFAKEWLPIVPISILIIVLERQFPIFSSIPIWPELIWAVVLIVIMAVFLAVRAKITNTKIEKEKFKDRFEVSGNTNLQLTLKNGEKISIGTRKWVELEEVLNKLKKQQNERRSFVC